MSIVQAPALNGITSFTQYPGGKMRECRVNQHNVIETPYGDFVPQYSSPGIRKKDLKSLSFYENGAVRSICLEEQCDVKSPVGVMLAELVTFHEDGSLDSVFPLNGQLGFSWSEQEEAQLAQNYEFEFSFAKFSAKIIGIRFYENGAVRSLILWPGEVVPVRTSLGTFPARTGFKLYEDGSLASFEPAVPIAVKTPIGDVMAFDVTAVGVDADLNSVKFDRDGRLKSLITSGDIVVRRHTGVRVMFSSRTKPGLLDDVSVKMPIELKFIENSVIINDGVKSAGFKIGECSFLPLPDFSMAAMECGGSCDGCSGCG
jgi:hypothetical protein